jgi:hypothetical protein
MYNTKNSGLVTILLVLMAIAAIGFVGAGIWLDKSNNKNNNFTENYSEVTDKSSTKNINTSTESSVPAVPPSNEKQFSAEITYVLPSGEKQYTIGENMLIKWENKIKEESSTIFLICNTEKNVAPEDFNSTCGEILLGKQFDGTTSEANWKVEEYYRNDATYQGLQPIVPGKYRIVSETYFGSDKFTVRGASKEFIILPKN